MKPAKKIERLIKKSRYKASSEVYDKALSSFLQAVDAYEKQKPALTEPNIWRIIMKSKITKIAAAAVIIIAVMIVIHWFCGSIDIAKPAYGITDLPELIKNAKTMHMQGCFYSPQPEQKTGEPVKLEFDYWFDTENGRYRLYKPGGIDKDTGKPKYFITVSDGQYVMSSAFNRSRSTGRTWKSISFTKLSPFKARLEAYKTSYGFLMMMFGNIDQIEGSTKVGQEEIEGVVFDVWESEFFVVNRSGNKIKTWLAPESGDLGRVLFWQTRGKDESDLRLVFDLHTIELGVVPPEGIFDTNPPDGYILNNTKETAQVDTLGIDILKGCRGDYELHTHIGFTLNDGSVILGWSCPDKKRSSQIDLFKNLTLGGKLPELAGKIEALTSIPPKPSIKYMGHHLAYTQKDEIFYEWSLYVPDKKPPTRNSLLGYNLNIKYQVDENAFGDRPGSLGEDLVIDTNKDFNTWVLGAIAELSDDEKVPVHVTYENVLQLAKRIRDSLNK